jgi:hypothetical protein
MEKRYEHFRKQHYGMYPTLFIDLGIWDGIRNADEVESNLNAMVRRIFNEEFYFLEEWLVSNFKILLLEDSI